MNFASCLAEAACAGQKEDERMKTVVGILNSQSKAALAVERLKAVGIVKDQINVLTPGASSGELADILTTETEQPGTASAIGGVVGAALGAAGGMSVGTSVAALVVPGVGSVFAIGLVAAALLGAGGAVGGAAAGMALEDSMAPGLPIDELFVYEDALRQGRTIVIAVSEDESQAQRARETLREAGAESVDAARQNWWVGLKDDERAVYRRRTNGSGKLDASYRNGVEAALHPTLGRKPYAEAVKHLRAMYPEEYADESFRSGYRRGYAYYRDFLGNDKHARNRTDGSAEGKGR